jgi:hypothetical protein
MSKLLSLKMDDRVFAETEAVLQKIKIPRNAYVNQAVDFYNRCQKRLLIKKKLKKDVQLLKKDTRDFLKSFELLEDLPE